MTTRTIVLTIGGIPVNMIFTPVDGLMAPVKAGTVVGTVEFDRTGVAQGVVMDIPDLEKFTFGGLYPKYKVIAKTALPYGPYAVGVAPLPTGGELVFNVAKAPVVDPPVEPPPVAGLPAGAVTAIADVMALDATNTGCRRTDLKTSGAFGTTKDGQVIEGLRINGRVTISHKNVVMRDCIVEGDEYYAILADDRNFTGDGLTIEYCTISKSINAVAGKIKSMYRCNVFGVDNGMNLWSGCLIVNNWIHDLGYSKDGHNDGIENNGCSGMQALYNRIVTSPQTDTSAIMTNNEFGAINDGLIQGNYLEGGQYTIYADNRKVPSNPLVLTVSDNTIKSGHYGAFALYTSKVTQSGNTIL